MICVQNPPCIPVLVLKLFTVYSTSSKTAFPSPAPIKFATNAAPWGKDTLRNTMKGSIVGVKRKKSAKITTSFLLTETDLGLDSIFVLQRWIQYDEKERSTEPFNHSCIRNAFLFA